MALCTAWANIAPPHPTPSQAKPTQPALHPPAPHLPLQMKETEEEQQARLERFSKEIEQGAAPPEHP